MIGKVEVKPSTLQIPINTILLTKSPLVWSQDNVIILTTQLKLCILELESSNQSSSIDLQFKRYTLEAPETMNQYIPSGADFMKSIRLNGTKLVNEFSLSQLTTTSRRAEINLGCERVSKPSQISGELCHNGYRKTITSCINMSKNNGCLLCSLTYDHQLCIINKVYDSYEILHNLSAIWHDHIKSNLPFSEDYQSYMHRKRPSMFIKHQCFYDIFWTPTYKDESGHYSLLVAITASNHVVSFKIPSANNTNQIITIQNCSGYNFENTSCIYFLPDENLEGMLVLGSSDGNITLYKLNFANQDFINKIGSVKQVSRSPITHVCLRQVQQHRYLLLSARSNVFIGCILNMDNDSVNETASAYQCGNFCITGIHCFNENVVYATLSTGVVMKYSFNTTSNFDNMTIDTEQLFKFDRVSFNGFAQSPNNCLWAIYETISVAYDHLVTRSPSSIHVFGVNKPETLYDFALKKITMPIQQKEDVIENIRLYAARGLFNSLLKLLLNEKIDWNSINYLQIYLSISRICMNISFKNGQANQSTNLVESIEKVQSCLVKHWMGTNDINPVNDMKTNHFLSKIYHNSLTSCNMEDAPESTRCMLCGKEDNSVQNFCHLCMVRMEEPMSEENFMPYCFFCHVSYSPIFHLNRSPENCLYCNKGLNSLKDILCRPHCIL